MRTLIFLFTLLFSIQTQAQTFYLKCYGFTTFRQSDCYGCGLKEGQFAGVIITARGIKYALHNPVAASFDGAYVTFSDQGGNKYKNRISNIGGYSVGTDISSFLSGCVNIDAPALTVSNIAGLQDSLDAKANIGESLPAGGTTGQVLGKASNADNDVTWGTIAFPPSTIDSVHTVVGLQDSLNAKANSLGVDDNYVTDAEKTKLSNLSGTNTGDQDLSGLVVKSSNLSDLTSASTARTNLGLGSLATQSGTFSGTSSGTNTGDQDLSGKQDVLVSGTNLKSVNGTSLLGSGNLVTGGLPVGGKQGMVLAKLSDSDGQADWIPNISENGAVFYRFTNATTTFFTNAATAGFYGNPTLYNLSGSTCANKAKQVSYQTTTGGLAGFIAPSSEFTAGRGSIVGMGGFKWKGTFCFRSDAKFGFIGLVNNATSVSIDGLTTHTNLVGLGWVSTDTYMNIVYNDASGNIEKVVLSDANFVRPTTAASNGGIYELYLESKPNGSDIYYKVIEIPSGVSYSGNLSSNIPAQSINQLGTRMLISNNNDGFTNNAFGFIGLTYWNGFGF